MRVAILFGTQSGNAELVADELLDGLGRKGHDAVKLSMAKSEPAVFDQEALFLVVLSSYGEGELPEKARPFFAKLQAGRPDLSRLRYGMFGLGDSKGHPHTYCFGPRKLDALLLELGATRVGELECHDLWDKRYAEEHALEWAGHLLE